MRAAWAEVERLVQANARHRRGFRLQEVDSQFVLEQAEGELEELLAAPDDPSELADLLGCLIHYAIKKGWSMEFVETELLSKLRRRFSEVPP